MPVTANSGSALLNAAFVGIPGIPNAFEAVLFRVVPTIVNFRAAYTPPADRSASAH